jgi:hypothetical protein
VANKENDSFVRWQGITREQFSATTNLVLGLGTGLLAFESTLLLDKKLEAACSVSLGVASLLLLFVSVAIGLFCAVNRLSDFRLTAQITKNSSEENKKVEEMRKRAGAMGTWTWRLFWAQLAFFGFGAVASASAVLFQLWR